MGFTVQQVRDSMWAKKRLHKAIALLIPEELGQYDQAQLKVLTLAEVLDMACANGCDASEGRDSLPNQVWRWMNELRLPSISTLNNATNKLSANQRLDMLAAWFNRYGGSAALGNKPFLGHPSLFNYFLNWLIKFLSEHGDIDGRISPQAEEMINAARAIKELPNVRRF